MNKKELKNNFVFSDILEKYNYAYGSVFLYLFDDEKQVTLDFKKLQAYIQTYISRFSVLDFYVIAANVFDEKIIEYILNEMEVPEHNISETQQICFLLAHQQAKNYIETKKIYLDTMKDVHFKFMELEKRFSDIAYELESLRKDGYRINDKYIYSSHSGS